jgi:hypothetical protein
MRLSGERPYPAPADRGAAEPVVVRQIAQDAHEIRSLQHKGLEGSGKVERIIVGELHFLCVYPS